MSSYLLVHQQTDMKCKGRKLTKYHVAFYSVLAAVLIVFIFKGMLLIARYWMAASSARCEQNVENNNQLESNATDVSDEFIFSVLVYLVLSILRFVEYALLGKGFYYFLFQQDKDSIMPQKFLTIETLWYALLFLVLLLPYLLLGFVIPGLGIYQEIDHSERVAKCYRHYKEVYITYCVVNLFRYMFAFTVRVMMMCTTLYLGKLWFPEGIPQHTSFGLFNKKRVTECKYASTDGNVQTQYSDINYLEDWKKVSSDYRARAENYEKIGQQVQIIQELFQVWFIVPWIVYFIASSLKTYNILRPWNADGDGDVPPSNIPNIYYLLYNINQLITLTIPFFCAKIMNTYHHKYFKIMRDYQIQKFIDCPSRLSIARQLVVERNEGYDFVPRIIGTSITISVGSPVYVILLLVGILLSVSQSLL